MLRSIRVRNFRSFSNSDKNSFIEIKPLTVLLGKNSSGKSSFLRTFPLLRQSVERE
ncbi:AAA family ATPase, partial [Vibrio cholerae]